MSCDDNDSKTPNRIISRETEKIQMSAELRARLKRCSRNNMLQITPKRACTSSINPSSLGSDFTISKTLDYCEEIRESQPLETLNSDECCKDSVVPDKQGDVSSIEVDNLSTTRNKENISINDDKSRDIHLSKTDFDVPVLVENNDGYNRNCSNQKDTENVGLAAVNVKANARVNVQSSFSTSITADESEINGPKHCVSELNSSGSTNADSACKGTVSNVERSCTISSHDDELSESSTDTCKSNRTSKSKYVEEINESFGEISSRADDLSMMPLDKLKELHRSATERISAKEETLRKLRMVKLYRTKNDLTGLKSLTSKWRSVCQEAVVDLQQCIRVEPQPSVTQLLHMLNIEPAMLGYDVVEEAFTP